MLEKKRNATLQLIHPDQKYIDKSTYLLFFLFLLNVLQLFLLFFSHSYALYITHTSNQSKFTFSKKLWILIFQQY